MPSTQVTRVTPGGSRDEAGFGGAAGGAWADALPIIELMPTLIPTLIASAIVPAPLVLLTITAVLSREFPLRFPGRRNGRRPIRDRVAGYYKMVAAALPAAYRPGRRSPQGRAGVSKAPRATDRTGSSGFADRAICTFPTIIPAFTALHRQAAIFGLELYHKDALCGPEEFCKPMFRLNTSRQGAGRALLSCLLVAAGSAWTVSAQERPGAAAPSRAQKPSASIDPTFHTPQPPLKPPKAAALTAHWIWLGPVVGDQQVETRTRFTLPARPRTAEVWITADDAFTLFVNGRKVEESRPVEQGWTHAHRRDVAAYLHAGRNVLAVQGINAGGGAAGVLVELDVNGVQTVVSDRRWKALLSTDPAGRLDGGLSGRFRLAERHGGRRRRHRRLGAGRDGLAAWGLRLVYGAQNAAAGCGGGAVRFRLGAEPHEPAATASGDGANCRPRTRPSSNPRQILVDFGKELSGRIEIAGTEGAAVEVHTGETREACLRILKDARLIAIDNSGPWLLTLHGSEVQTTPYTAFRYALLTFPGDRPVALSRVDCDFKYYPVEYKGAFDCSDPLLTRIWYTGAYTAHLCMQEEIWDAPKRDRGLWIGDMHVTGETINNVFADRFLMEKSLAGGRANAQRGRPDTQLPPADVNDIPGYTAAWFGTLADFYRHDGDLAFLRRQHPGILSLLAYQQTEFDARHLFSNPYHAWDFCDWAPEYVRDTPQTLAATDLFAIYGVRQAVFLLKALGDTANADRYGAWADRLDARRRAACSSIRRRRPMAGGCRRTRWRSTPESRPRRSRRRSIPPCFKAGTPAWKAPAGGDLAGSEVMSPYYGHYVLSAYGQMGRYQAGIDLLRRYWGGMLARGATTWWEVFDPSFPQDANWSLDRMPYVSLCHGWSSGPTSYLTEQILGVRPTAGGFTSVLIQPELGDLTWVEGTVPTPQGRLHLRAAKSSNGIVCTLNLPAGIHALVKLPGRTVTLDHAGRYTLRAASKP